MSILVSSNETKTRVDHHVNIVGNLTITNRQYLEKVRTNLRHEELAAMRKITPSYAKAIERINKEVAEAGEENDITADVCVIASIAGVNVGAVTLSQFKGMGRISNLYVSQAHRNKGIGKGLLAECKQLLRALGCTHVELGVLASNTKVVSFYRKHGFTAIETEMAARL